MEFLIELVHQLGKALLHFLIFPYYFIAILFIMLQFRQQVLLERKLLQSRLHSVFDRTWRMIFWGLAGGLAASIIMAFLGVVLQPAIIIYLAIISFIAILFRVRFLCIAYSIGFIGILHSLLMIFPTVTEYAELQPFLRPLLDLEMSSLIALVAVLHFIEALYVRFQGGRAATPVFYESKRGRIVGAYRLQQFWAVPLLLIVPASGPSSAAIPWAPLLGTDVGSGGWTVVALPVVLGFSAFSIARLPLEQSRFNAKILLIYSAVMMALAVLIYFVPVLTIAASVASIVCHEAIIWWNQWKDKARSPIFAHGPDGLKILAVLPGSAAEELGLQAGEIIHKVNGVKVLDKKQLHQAMRMNSAFCKLEVINLAGQSKFVQRALFAGEHHQLGIVLAPDQDTTLHLAAQEQGLLAYLPMKVSGIARNEQLTKDV